MPHVEVLCLQAVIKVKGVIFPLLVKFQGEVSCFLYFTFFIDSLITFGCVGFTFFFATFLDIKLYSRG